MGMYTYALKRLTFDDRGLVIKRQTVEDFFTSRPSEDELDELIHKNTKTPFDRFELVESYEMG